MNYIPLLASILLLAAVGSSCASTDKALGSWNESAAAPLVEFVQRVSDPASPDFVPVPERIAVFDNDGTLWAEQPLYFQLSFALEWMQEREADHPEWRAEPPLLAALEGDMRALAATGRGGILRVLEVSHSGVSSEEFSATVEEWLESARHSTTGRRYTEMAYIPMREMLDYLRANGFKTFIVSGGGLDFMRVFAEDLYGIPSHHIVGSSIEIAFEHEASGPSIQRLPRIEFLNDEHYKPLGIQRFIGRRPILAVGNSDGDHEMLQWTAAGEGARLCAIVHHTDAEREWSYDRNSSIGRLDEALDQARREGWWVIDMARDWRQVFAWQEPEATAR